MYVIELEEYIVEVTRSLADEMEALMPMLGWTKNMACMQLSLRRTMWPTGSDAMARGPKGGRNANVWTDQEREVYGMELE